MGLGDFDARSETEASVRIKNSSRLRPCFFQPCARPAKFTHPRPISRQLQFKRNTGGKIKSRNKCSNDSADIIDSLTGKQIFRNGCDKTPRTVGARHRQGKATCCANICGRKSASWPNTRPGWKASSATGRSPSSSMCSALAGSSGDTTAPHSGRSAHPRNSRAAAPRARQS